MWCRSVRLPTRLIVRLAWCFLFLVTSVLWASPSVAQVGKPEGLYYKSWAVIFGIEDYLVAGQYPGAVREGKRVAEAFRQLGFDEVIEFYDKKASSKQIHHVLDSILPRKLARGDRLVLYFIGRAGQTTDLNGKPLGYLVPWDAHVGAVTKAVTMDELKQFGRRVMAKHVLLLLDAGVSAWDVTPSQQLSLEGRTAPEQDTDKRVLQVLSSGPFTESPAISEGPNAFTEALVEGLRGAADGNKNGWLMASELSQYVRDRVQAQRKGARAPQFARLDGDGDTVLIEGKETDFVAGPAPTTPEEKARAAKAQYEQAFALMQNQTSPDEALERLNNAIALNPAYGDAYVLKSYFQLEIQPNLSEALAAAELAVRYAPANPDSHYTLGLVYDKQGRYPEAEAAYLEALTTNPDYTDVFLSLGVLYEDKLNDTAKAGEAYRRYQALGGTDNRASLFLRQHPTPAPQ